MKRILFFILLFFLLTHGIAQADLSPTNSPFTRPITIKSPGVALVLGGGGARGFAHIGVIRVLEQAHIPIDLIVGTSAGSIAGVVYADNPNSYALEQTMLKASTSALMDISVLHFFQGPIKGIALQNFIRTYVRARNFSELKIPFIAVATDLDTGKVFPINKGLIAPAINASSALPPFFHPVKYKGNTLVDGGVIDPVPVDIARRYHPKLIIAVDISQQLSPQKPKSILGVFARSHIITILELSKLLEKKADIVIYPQVGQTGLFSDSQKMQLIEAGEIATRQALPKIKELLRRNEKF